MAVGHEFPGTSPTWCASWCRRWRATSPARWSR